MKTKDLQDYLRTLQKDLEAKGLEYFMVVAVPGTHEGASIYNGRNLADGAATNARNAHMDWEKRHGIDTKHDWSKEAVPVWKRWR